MAEFTAPANKQEFESNFEQLKPLMNDTQAYYESSRCLFCFDAPCITACPTGIDIPLFIRQINSGNREGAAATIYASNWFGYACGKVCPTEVLCEGACVYNHQDVKPIEIGRLQSYATSAVVESGKSLFRLAPANGKAVAIIGAGPAGLSAACELRMLGFAVEVFEAGSKPSGLTVNGVAPYKITNKEVLDEMDWLEKQFGFVLHYNRRINSREEIEALEKKFDAIFLGVGLGSTAKRGLEGEDLPGCIGAVEFVERLRSDQHTVAVPERVVVIGGGNTAMDVASEAARMGAREVTLCYRRSKDAMSAYTFEYELAKGVGVKGRFNLNPKAIEKNGDKLNAIFNVTEQVAGSLQTTDAQVKIECDLVIRATGQEKQVALFDLIGLDTDEKGRLATNAEFQTSNERYFAAGDAVNGGAEVVNAVAEAKVAANAINKFCFPG